MSGALENPAAIKTKQNITKKKDFACYTTITVLSLLLLLKKTTHTKVTREFAKN